MTKSTRGFHKIVGATIASVRTSEYGQNTVLIDTNGVKYTIHGLPNGQMKMLKESPRKSRAKAKSGPQMYQAAWPYATLTEPVVVPPKKPEETDLSTLPYHGKDEEYALEHEAYGVSEITEQFTRLVSEQLGVRLDQVELNSHFVADLGADSLDIVELVMCVEDYYHIELSDEELEKYPNLNVQMAINLLYMKLNPKLYN